MREDLRLSWSVVVEKVLLRLVVHGSKKTMAKWCEICFPLQAELARCACIPKAVLLVSHMQDALKAEDNWNSMARAAESLGELQEPASLTPLPPLGSRAVSAPSSRLPLGTPMPAETNTSNTVPYPHHSSVLLLESSPHTAIYGAWLLEGRLGLPWLGEPAASGRAALLCCLSSTDIQGFPSLAISPLLSGEEPGRVWRWRTRSLTGRSLSSFPLLGAP